MTGLELSLRGATRGSDEAISIYYPEEIATGRRSSALAMTKKQTPS